MPPTRTLSTQASGAQRGRYLLVVCDESSQVHPLADHGAVWIGRAADAQIRIDDPGCSRRHANIHLAPGALHLDDLGSHNGTRLNGRPIAGTIALESGDVISIGKAALVVHAPAVEQTTRLVEPATLRERCAEEIERAIRYERPVALLAIGLHRAVSPAALAAVVAAELRPLDVATLSRDGELLVLVPEHEEAALETATRLVATLTSLDPEVRAGVACCPRDGCRFDALVATARTARARAAVGGAQVVADGDTRLQVGDRAVLVADPAMAQIYQLLRRLAASELPVLVMGETGVGKENVAHALHAWSSRAAQPFIAINCAALNDGLVESELFGHERGAFSGAVTHKLGLLEAAVGGTVFLDEIGELPLATQAKLLRVMELKRIVRVGGIHERPIDVRFVAATNRTLTAEVEAGRFRRDLLYRIMGATVTLPPLRDRASELALHARAFLDEACAVSGRPPAVLSAAAMDALVRYGWPGNIRELKNEMAYVAATTDSLVVEPWHLSERIAGAPPPLASDDAPGGAPVPTLAFRPIAEELRDLERGRMLQALAASGDVQKRAAELIGMPGRTFRMKARQYGITRSSR